MLNAKKIEFIEKLNNLTFNALYHEEKDRFFVELTNFLNLYLSYDLIFIGITDSDLKKLNVIFASEKGKIIKTQILNLSNTMTLLTLKSKKEYTLFEDITKVPDTLYGRLEDSKIKTSSFIGIPLKDKYKRNHAILGLERETKGRLNKFEIDILLYTSKNLEYILNNEIFKDILK